MEKNIFSLLKIFISYLITNYQLKILKLNLSFNRHENGTWIAEGRNE